MKEYIGDGVYAEFDGHDIVLTTENGISQTNCIVLDPDVIRKFERFLQRVKEEILRNR